MHNQKTLHNRILDVLRNRKEDITTMQIAKEVNIDRHTAAKHLDVLQTQGLLEYRTIGKSKVWKVTDSAFIKVLQGNNNLSSNLKQILGSMDEQISIQGRDFRVVWNNKGHMTKHKCHEEYAQSTERCKNCPVQKTFITGKPSSTVMRWPKGKMKITAQPIKNESDDTVAVVEIVKKM
jgi:Mn-dependent DtxR family transcriptional regulator